MAIADVASLTTKVGNLLGAASTSISADGKAQAAEQTLAELNWTLPNTDTKQCYWLIERCKRHTLYILMVEVSLEFRFKQIHLQQKFDHLIKLIQKMDEEFALAIENDIGVFDPAIDLTEFAQYINMYIPAGFVYDKLGKDITYLQP